MSRIDVTDRDPFANADAEPKDNVTAIGFLTRLVFRFGVYRLVGSFVAVISFLINVMNCSLRL